MLSDFVTWIRIEKNRILEEGVWGNWDYTIPTDKKEQMYDFYMMESLLPPGIQMYLPSVRHHADEPEEGQDARTVEDKYYNALHNMANKLIPHLKKELIQVVEFSVAAEMRHLWDHADTRADPVGMLKKVEKKFGPKEVQMLKNLAMIPAAKQHALPKALINMDREKLHPNLATSNEDYKGSYRAMKAAGGTPEEWMKLASWLFRNVPWNGAYGGEKWAQIADGWLGLYNSKTTGQEIAAIDHIYDLQHNTGSVFTKVGSYVKDGSYKWINKALDHKRYLVSMHEMMEHVSPAMRELAAVGIKLKTGKTWQDFEKEWPEILKRKTEIYNDVKKNLWDTNKEIMAQIHEYKNRQMSGGTLTQKEKEKLASLEKQYKDNKDKYEAEYGYYSAPQSPMTPEQFATSHVHKSEHPWSVYHFGKQLQEIPDTYDDQNVPAFDDIQIGDKISITYPAKMWYTVNNKIGNAGGTGIKQPMVVTDDLGTVFYDLIKAYRPKSPGAGAGAGAGQSHVGSHLDATGNKIEIGDTVKKQYSHSGKQGKVINLLPHNNVQVQWPAYNKEYSAGILVIVSKFSAVPQAEPVVPPFKDIKIGDQVSFNLQHWYTVMDKMHGGGGSLALSGFNDGFGSNYAPYSQMKGYKPAAVHPGIPPFEDIQIGDQVSDDLHTWHTVKSKSSTGGGHYVIFDSSGGSNYIPYNDIKGYKPKDQVAPAAQSPKHVDAIGVEINVGDTVETQHSEYQGKVISLLAAGNVEVYVSGLSIKSAWPAHSLIVVYPSNVSSTSQHATGGTNVIPEFKDIRIGDQVAVHWPATSWFTVKSKAYKNGLDVIGVAATHSNATLDLAYEGIKGYKPKSQAAVPPQQHQVPSQGGGTNVIPPLENIQIGDQVAVHWPALSPSSWFTVKNKSPIGGNYVVLTTGNLVYNQIKGYKPKAQAAAPSQQPGHGSKQWMHSPAPEKPKAQYQAPTSLSSQQPFPAANKPSFTPPTPEEKEATIKEKTKSIYDGLPQVTKTLKYARTIKGLGGVFSTDNMLNTIEKSLNVKIDKAERDATKKAIEAENAIETYYKHRGHLKFPSGFTAEQAFTSIQTKFPTPPHVSMDSDTMKAINDAIMDRKYPEAMKLAKKATQYDLSAVKGWIVLKGLEAYMDKKS